MKKAILIVSFGTTYKDSRKLTIDEIENKIKENFKEYEIRKTFTSHMIIKKLKERDGIFIDTPEEAMEKLKKEGFEEVIVQPLHIIPGEEYDYIENVVQKYIKEKAFLKLAIGRPALYYKCSDVIDDYAIMADVLRKQLPEDMAVVLMGHGTKHVANAAYSCFQLVLKDKGFNNVYVGTVEGYPTLNEVIGNLENDEVKEVMLMPLMVTAGDHAINDMSGENEDSWKNILENRGFKVHIYLHGFRRKY